MWGPPATCRRPDRRVCADDTPLCGLPPLSRARRWQVDNNTFATVLELCEGGDLETHLREHGVLPEREARAVLAQVFSGLAYLNTPEKHDQARAERLSHRPLPPPSSPPCRRAATVSAAACP